MRVKPEIILQFSGKEFTTDELMQKATEAYQKESKNTMQAVKVYVKPEENAMYYVVNEEETGSIAI